MCKAQMTQRTATVQLICQVLSLLSLLSRDVNKNLKMKQNKTGQKVSTTEIKQDPGPSG